ncbi:hypothetical protein AJ79_09374 [Helicocarpus griseus UAMH5409]|uniref:NADH:flavin oxidoreductase/NADH oxidase N-terminal domain-containing protein n=1 Tax=Helicocarpus griseus UAMH5409 TaxID=1447875 RepID=A0A2B7WK52_9EURO|nr:hypothetical protein AJ79_09374 [Helicocarpus griseus UAMH5409]
MDSAISQPLTLKCGLQMKNRLVKAAMAEGMADKDNLPTVLHEGAYEQWGRGGWGMVLTGNVQVDMAFCGQPGDNAVNPQLEEELNKRWKLWAAACTRHDGTPTIVQINHPGRQSPLGARTVSHFAKNIAPSPVPLNFGTGIMANFASSVMFGTPREMTQEDIDRVVEQFAHTSCLVNRAGFHGVQLHAAHGYLLSTFLSSQTNQRTDIYGKSAAGRAKIVVDIVHAIRAALPNSFCVGIKLNSVDHQSKDELAQCIEQVKLIAEAGVDFVEISGGTYENPSMMSNAPQHSPEKSSRTIAREAFFLEFAEAIRSEFPTLPLIVTGGFRTRQGMARALEDGHCDMVGLGRPAVLYPALPNDMILNPDVPDEEAKFETTPIQGSAMMAKLTGIKSIGSGAESKWYSSRIQKMGLGSSSSEISP